MKIYPLKDFYLKKVLEGVELANKAISSTFGPYGRNVFLNRPSGLFITKDGLSVARELSHPDPIINLGVTFVKEACIEVNSVAGDGSTTTSILFTELFRLLVRAVASDTVPQFQKDLTELKDTYLEYITQHKRLSEDRETLRYLALNTANENEDIAEVVMDAIEESGSEGFINIIEGKKTGFNLSSFEGYVLDTSLISEEYLQGKTELHIEDPILAIFTQGLSTYKDIAPCLEEGSRYAPRPIVVLAPYIIGEAATTIIKTNSDTEIECHAVNLLGHPFFSSIIEDNLCAITGATKVTKIFRQNNSTFDLEWFGGASSIRITRQKTILENPTDCYDRILNRIDALDSIIDKEKDSWTQKKIREQKGYLSGGFVNIEMCLQTETETREARGRIEDTLFSVQGALEEGLLPGGGNFYFFLSQQYPDNSVAKALMAPMRSLLISKGVVPPQPFVELYNSTCSNPWTGWDLVAEKYRAMNLKPYILNSAKTIRLTLEKVLSLVYEISKTGVVVKK